MKIESLIEILENYTQHNVSPNKTIDDLELDSLDVVEFYNHLEEIIGKEIPDNLIRTDITINEIFEMSKKNEN
ncbi:acyl carrier protein [Idiomarina sp. M1R2S28]|uniref:Acyl carrier protein n=1 Tax=Idiomarina rhizosphaerae TaxID=2961572 RepID=A0A9X2G5T0_9GAMM|nr:acyl carrier protein [Idiomarina rhizosphaerae]MCP1340383.1 acyl carrier protein [Idiomarina rhizosphaerae]